jgi:serine protease Do
VIKPVQKYYVMSFLLLGVVLIFLSCNNQQAQVNDENFIDSVMNEPSVLREIPREYEVQSQVDDSRRTAITRAVAAVSPAVVSVTAVKIKERTVYVDPFFRRFFGDIYRNRKYREKIPTIGSGFIVTNDGYVVTNDHVAGEASEITISTANGKEYPARLVGGDFISDIALLKIDNDTFKSAELGTAEDLLIGEWAIALGSPFGLFQHHKPTVTVGVISATDRDFGRIDEGRIYQDMIQTDASINSGNSGGPLVNALGQVIGMNTFIYTGDGYSTGSVGLGFAIPIDRIKEIIKGIKSNKIDRDFWIGLEYLPLNKFLAKEMGYPEAEGIYVARIRHKSPAQKAGIELGDIIVEVNGYPVKDSKSVEAAMGSDYLKVGDVLKIKVWRQGKIIPLSIILEKRER